MEQLIIDYAMRLLEERPFLRIEFSKKNGMLTLTSYYGTVKTSYKYYGVNISSKELHSNLSKHFSMLNNQSFSSKYELERIEKNVWILFHAEVMPERKLDLEQADLSLISKNASAEVLYNDFKGYVENSNEAFISMQNFYTSPNGSIQPVKDNQVVRGSEKILFGEFSHPLNRYPVSRNFILSLPRKDFEVYRIKNDHSPEMSGYFIKKVI